MLAEETQGIIESFKGNECLECLQTSRIICKVKVKSLCLTKGENGWRSGDIAPRFLTLALDERE
jgi:hypothetical protein